MVLGLSCLQTLDQWTCKQDFPVKLLPFDLIINAITYIWFALHHRPLILYGWCQGDNDVACTLA